jgi:hypothetical protein
MTSPPWLRDLREKAEAVTNEVLFRLACFLGSTAARAYVKYGRYWQIDDDWLESPHDN